MTYEEALAYTHGLKRFSGAPTLERMEKLMCLLGNPQEKLRVVHIAGTNGKGSTAAMTAAILRTAGLKTGLTVSPFIVDFCERIQIDGKMIPRHDLAEEMTRVRRAAEQVENVTEFEFITAAAYDYFYRQGCDAVVAEVGLGGRFDATNIIKRPLVSVITAIDLDHTAILGDTLTQIAYEKCGIIKTGVPVVSCGGQDLDALGVIMEQCAEKGCELICPNLNSVTIQEMSLEGTDLTYEGLSLHIPLAGKHQINNALTAVQAARKAFQFIGIPSGARFVAQGIVSVHFPARMELLHHEPPVILDGAHNPAGARALGEALSLACKHPLTAIMGVLADKDSASALEALAPHFKRIFCVTPENPRALDAAALAARAGAYCADVRAYEHLADAYDAALETAQIENGAVVICGSLYLAAQARGIVLAKEN